MKKLILALTVFLFITPSFSTPKIPTGRVLDSETSSAGKILSKEIHVTTFSDRESDDGLCSLREAVTAANTETDYSNCAITGTGTRFTIYLEEGTYGVDSNITLKNSITLIGAGSEKTILDINTDYIYSIWVYNNDGGNMSVTLSSLEVTGSRSGSGISFYSHNSKTNLLLTDVLLKGNGIDGSSYGGGLYVHSIKSETNVIVKNSVVKGNYTYNYYEGDTYGSGKGAGMYFSADSEGSLTVNIYNSQITSNYGYEGAGIALSNYKSTATLNITNTTISGNSQKVSSNTGDGGGLYVYTNNGGVSTVNLENSTLSYNYAYHGGGIYTLLDNIETDSIKLVLRNSTLSNNNAKYSAGGIYVGEGVELLVENSTISGNTATYTTGGIYTSVNSKFSIKNSILANNMVGGTPNDCDYAGDFTSFGYNLVETNCDLNLTGTDDQQGVDPQLENLADNGGSTYTQALSSTSPAIDAGSCTDSEGNPIEKDQRGEKRDDAKCDIGAYEYQEGEEAGGSTSSSSSGTDTEGGTEATGEGTSGTTTTGSESSGGESTSGTSGSSTSSGGDGGGSTTGDGSENVGEPASSCSFHEV